MSNAMVDSEYPADFPSQEADARNVSSQWEYHVSVASTRMLQGSPMERDWLNNKAGALGWELVAVTEGVISGISQRFYYFKKPKA